MTSIVQSTLGLSEADIQAISDALGLTSERKEILSLNFTAEEWAKNQKIREAVAFIWYVKLYEKTDAKTDLMFFLNVFLERGNNLQKALLRCDDVIAPVLRRKACGIVLEKTQNKTILGTRHLTLARMAQAFAHLTATLLLKD